jgi:hypothetical protein
MSGEAKVVVDLERVTLKEGPPFREWRVTVTATCLAGETPRSITTLSHGADPQVALGGALYEAASYFLRRGG